MTIDRRTINRRASAARRLVLKRLQEEQPRRYEQWLAEAYEIAIAADEAKYGRTDSD